jgi:hypothetical protein
MMLDPGKSVIVLIAQPEFPPAILFFSSIIIVFAAMVYGRVRGMESSFGITPAYDSL